MNKELLQGETLQPYRVSPCSRGFTLIELLVVIAILGILSAGILTAINVTSNLDKARLAKAKTFSKSLENSLSVSQVGKWSFEEVTNNKTPDTSGYGNEGTLVNAPVWETAENCGLGFGRCLKFDQSNYVTIPHSPNLNLSSSIDMTISAWINPNTIASVYHVLGKRIGCGGGGVNYMFVLESGKFSFSSSTGISSVSLLKSGVWTFIVASISSTGQVKLYIDGKLDNEGSVTFGATNTEPLKIGDVGTGCLPYNRFSGFMDEVAIYNKALTSYQVQQLYAQGLPRHLLARQSSN